MTNEKRFAAAASWVLICWGVGHATLIDILPLVFGVYPYDADPALFEQMRESAFRFPYTGRTTAYLAFYGLSIWLAVSLIAVGVLNLLLARSNIDQPSRRRIYLADIVIVAAFLIIASICFFAIPVIGGVLALILYSLAMLTSGSSSPAAE